MKNYCNMDISELTGKHKCECGKEHDIKTQCLLSHGAFKNAAEFLARFVPPMSRVALVCDDEQLAQTFFDAVKRDYRVYKTYTDATKAGVERTVLPEDTKLIVAAGSIKAINGAKFIAYVSDLPVIAAAPAEQSCLTSVCTLNDDGLPLSYKVSAPAGYIFDLDFPLSERKRAALFGSVAAKLNTSFEHYVAGSIEADSYCPHISGAITDIAAKTVLSASQRPVSDDILEAALKIALLESLYPVPTGEVQCALTYSMLTEGFDQGELQLVFAAVLSPLYISHICHRRSFLPPPDNNYRLEKIAEFTDVSETRAIRLICPQLSGKEAAIAEYKLREYSKDMLEKLHAGKNLLGLAFRTFKRMYGDGGYFLRDLIGRDISLSIALAPDIINGNGMLTILKKLGDLDDYII